MRRLKEGGWYDEVAEREDGEECDVREKEGGRDGGRDVAPSVELGVLPPLMLHCPLQQFKETIGLREYQKEGGREGGREEGGEGGGRHLHSADAGHRS